MAFLIGIIIFIVFVAGCIVGLRQRIRAFCLKYFHTTDIKSVIERAEIEDQELPKSLSSMDSIYLDQINRDFPGININELKSMCRETIFNIFRAIDEEDSSIVNDSVRELVKNKISDNNGKSIKHDNLNIHKVVISRYENNNGVATIHFGCSFEYYYSESNKIRKKVQDRAMIDFVYIIDESKVPISKKNLGLNCPNCGSPLNFVGEKICSYCKTPILDIVKRVWVCNSVKFY